MRKLPMANAVNLATKGLRILLIGYPGTAKTGCLAALLNAGFKMRYIDFDGNLDPLINYSDPSRLHDLDAVFLEDKMRAGGRFMEPVGIPHAFADALKLMDEWKYTDEEGKEVNLGSSKDWGPDTVVVLDSTTKLGDACMRRAMKLLNRTPDKMSQQVWGLAIQEQGAFLEKLTSPTNRFHIIVIAHLKIVSPREVLKDDDRLTATIKEEQAELVPTRLYPSVLGHAFPQFVGAEFPIIIEAEKVTKGGVTKRTLNTSPKVFLDLKCPMPNIPAQLPIESGMLTLFKALSPKSVELVKANGVATHTPITSEKEPD
jgi:hypothetical protein